MMIVLAGLWRMTQTLRERLKRATTTRKAAICCQITAWPQLLNGGDDGTVFEQIRQPGRRSSGMWGVVCI